MCLAELSSRTTVACPTINVPRLLHSNHSFMFAEPFKLNKLECFCFSRTTATRKKIRRRSESFCNTRAKPNRPNLKNPLPEPEVRRPERRSFRWCTILVRRRRNKKLISRKFKPKNYFRGFLSSRAPQSSCVGLNFLSFVDAWLETIFRTEHKLVFAQYLCLALEVSCWCRAILKDLSVAISLDSPLSWRNTTNYLRDSSQKPNKFNSFNSSNVMFW